MFIALAAMGGFVVAFVPTPTSFASPQSSVRKITPPGPSVRCADDVQLTLSAANASQGSLLLGRFTAGEPLANIAANLDGEPIPVWKKDTVSDGAAAGWRLLVPVNLEQTPGKYLLAVDAKTNKGEKITCQLSVPVNAGKFATESLKVAPQFVEPDPQQLERAKAEQQRLRDIYATVTPEKLWHGPFRTPLDGVTSGKNFGRRRVLNGEPSSPHTGVDFPAPTGTPVHAPQAGKVVLAEPLFFAGNTVIIDHGLGVYTLYGHLSQISVKVGDSLTPGEILGKVGATGRVTGPHLHWGLTIGRAHVDALQIVHLGAM
jgi:murein DD-endopeptidase MepM/ murein hydrolase activator NlpD